MQVRVLGTIAVVTPADVALGGPTQRRVLSSLVLNADQVVSVDQLVDAVWPDGDVPERAEHNVRTYVHRLRTALDGAGERIETAGTGYRLRLARDELDAARFEDLVAEARAAASEADTERTQALLDQAFELWGGRPYDEFADEEWARAEVARLGEVRASALEHRFAALLDAGRHTEVVGSLQDAVTEEPWREARRMQLALALYRSGRQAEALRSIQSYKSDLAGELGLEPSRELDRLEHQILDHDPALFPASHQQHMLRGYQLDEVMGEGAFSLVWRGAQPSLGRTVAIKQIRAELANQPDFVRRFATEAQTVAALEHPHIVPLYDYWREPDNAYLVMRHVAGGTLESSVLDGGLDEPRLRRFVDQVGSALHTAHRAGVIHRDVKSANVLIDGDDNFYLTDFGIALTGSVADDEMATALSTGSPAYASPEQLRRQPLDDRTDVYGFGITLFEAATGRLPFVDAPTKAALVKRQLEDPVPAPTSVTPGLPTWVDYVVARATAKSPSDRFASIADLIAAIPSDTTSVTDPGLGLAGATVIGTLVNPFKALRAFVEADAADFHGRERLVARFVDVLARPGSAGRLLAVIGPSGSGKSSAVRSGLLPQLRVGAVPGSQNWFISTMLPGGHPFEEFESALNRVAVRQPGPLVEMMSGDDRGIARAVNQILPDEESELLIVIDQFEELFTHTEEAMRTRFLDGMLAAVKEPRSRLRVVVTIRADFLDRPLRHPQLAARLESAAVTVSPLAADELEAAIVEPVRRQGGVYEPGLVARIMADVGDQPGALPLLQYALTELFDRHVSGLLQAESYDAIGGLTGALATRAESTLTEMPADQQALTRRLFGRLVTLGEGTEDTRRRVRRSELGTGREIVGVTDTFGAARLLVFDHDPATREPTVEIAHEALLQAWPRLRRWLDDDRVGLRIHRHLTDTAGSWLSSDKDPGELYRGGRLETALTWATDHRPEFNPIESEFLDASVSAHEAELAAKQALFDQQVSSNRRLRLLVTAAAVIAMIAGAAGIFALQQRSRADDEATEARTQREIAEDAADDADAQRVIAQDSAADAQEQRDSAVSAANEANTARLEAESAAERADVARVRATALNVIETDPALAMLLAAEADRIEPTMDGKDVLHQLLTGTNGIERFLPATYTNLWLINGGLTAVALGADGVDLWDLEKGTRTILNIGRPPSTGPTGSQLDVSDAGGVMAISDEHGTDVYKLGNGELTWSAPRGGAAAVVFSPDGAELAIAFDDGTEIWDLADLGATEPAATLPGAQSLEWHPRGEGFVIIAPDSSVEFWPTGSSEPAWSVEGRIGQGQRPMILFTSNGDEVVATQSDESDPVQPSVRRFSVVDGSLIGTTRELATAVDGWMWFDEEERHLGIIGASKNAVALDLVDGGTTDPPFESLTAFTMDYSDALGRYVVGGTLGIALHDPAWSGPLERRINFVDPRRLDHRGGPGADSSDVDGVFRFHSLSQDGTRLLVSGWSPALGAFPIEEYDLTDDRLRGRVSELTGAGVIGNNGHTLLVSGDGFLMLDDERRPIGDPVAIDGRFPLAYVASPDGRFFAVSWAGEPAELYRNSGELVTELVVPGAGAGWLDLSFSGDGSRIAGHVYGSSPTAEPWAIWDTDTGRIVDRGAGSEWARPWLAGDTMYVSKPTPSGELDFDLHRVDPETRESVGEPLLGQRALRVAVYDDGVGDLVVTHSFDGTVRLWDRDTGQQIGRATTSATGGGHPRALQLGGDGTVLTRIDPVAVSVWNLDIDTWADVACEFAGRNMTAEEWAEFGPNTIDHRATCPQYRLDT